MARSRRILAAGAVGVAAVALIAASSSVTGAYFTDSHNGALNASTGVVKVNVSDLQLNFTKLLPRSYQTQVVTYTAAGTAGEDIWLVLPTDGTAKMFNGEPGVVPEPAPLGRYGHFAVTSPAGSFSSFNLAKAHSGSTDVCGVNANGHSTGTPSYEATGPTDYPPFCEVPGAILLGSNLTYGQTQTATVTFGYTRLLKGDAYQNAPLAQVAQFKIVATQHGILPSDPNNVVR